MRRIHGEEVYGVEVDAETRCAHYRSELDVIAIRFKCCGRWFPCHSCHAARMDHEVRVWPLHDRDVPAILCGACGHQLTIREYLDSASSCTSCGQPFNPGCARHHHLYFEPSSGT